MNIKHILAMAGCTAVGVAVGWYSAKTYYDKIHKQDIEDLKHDLKEFYEVNGENAHLDHTEPSESDSKADIKRIIPHDEEKDRIAQNILKKHYGDLLDGSGYLPSVQEGETAEEYFDRVSDEYSETTEDDDPADEIAPNEEEEDESEYIHLIDEESYIQAGDNEYGYPKINLTWFRGSQTLVDDETDDILDEAHYLGHDITENLLEGCYSNLPALFIKNKLVGAYFEVMLENGDFIPANTVEEGADA